MGKRDFQKVIMKASKGGIFMPCGCLFLASEEKRGHGNVLKILNKAPFSEIPVDGPKRVM